MKTERKYLGTVEFSGRVVVSDPCYDRTTWCMQPDFPVRRGRYQVFATISDEGEMGLRVASLMVCHEDFVDEALALEWQVAVTDIGVDSGQCGFFDDSVYPQSKDHHESKPFYDECCEITLADSQAGLLQSGKGVVSSSGYGDGGYCLWAKEVNGENVALLLDFNLIKMGSLMMDLLQQQTGGEAFEEDTVVSRIIDRVDAEIAAYRDATQALSGKEVYNKFFEISLCEEVAFMIGEHLEDENYEEDHPVIVVLQQLTAGSGFLPAFVEWAISRDSVNVSNAEETRDTLEYFCDSWLEE